MTPILNSVPSEFPFIKKKLLITHLPISFSEIYLYLYSLLCILQRLSYSHRKYFFQAGKQVFFLKASVTPSVRQIYHKPTIFKKFFAKFL